MQCVLCTDVRAELSVSSPEVTEGGEVEVCVDIVEGTVGMNGFTITLMNDGGSATGG